MPTLSQHKRRETWWDIALVAPQFVLFFSLTILPFIISVPVVFTDRLNFMDFETEFVGFRNFVSIFEYPLDEQFLPALRRTAVFFLGNYVMVFALGMPLALFMFEFERGFPRTKNFFYTIIFLPWMISPFGVGLIIILLFSQDTGSLNLLFQELGWLSEPLNVKRFETTRVLLPILVGWRAAGFNMAIFLAGLLSLNQDTIDAADVDGCSYLQKLFYVYLPQMIPNVVMATIFCLMGSFALFDVVVGLGGLRGNPAARFLSIIIYELGFKGGQGENTGMLGTMAQGVAVQITVFVPLMAIAIYLNHLQRKRDYRL